MRPCSSTRTRTAPRASSRWTSACPTATGCRFAACLPTPSLRLLAAHSACILLLSIDQVIEFPEATADRSLRYDLEYALVFSSVGGMLACCSFILLLRVATCVHRWLTVMRTTESLMSLDERCPPMPTFKSTSRCDAHPSRLPHGSCFDSVLCLPVFYESRCACSGSTSCRLTRRWRRPSPW